MKRVIFALGMLLSLNTYAQLNIATNVKSFDFNIKIPGLVLQSPSSLSAGLLYGTRLIHYQVKNVEHIIAIPLSKSNVPLLHFINKNGTWKFENYYTSGQLEGANSFTILDSLGTIAISSTGDEGITVLGDVEVVKTIGDTLNIKKITTKKEYYADISSMDINNDGLSDIITYGGDWPNNILQVFIQTKEGDFINTPSLVPFTYQRNWDSTLVEDIYHSGYGVGVSNLFGDKSHPQIIRVQYGSWNLNQKRYGVAFHSFNKITNSYDLIDTVKTMGVMADPLNGGTKPYFVDVNNDGYMDFAIAIEGPNKDIYTQFYLNDGLNNYNAGQYLKFNIDTLNTGTIKFIDINNDGWMDMIYQAVGGNNYFINPTNFGNPGQGVNIGGTIFINNKGIFENINQRIDFYGIHPNYLMPTFVKNKLKYFGFAFPSENGDPLIYRDSLNNVIRDSLGNAIQFAPDSTRLIEIDLTICNNLVKPIFNTSNYSFCYGDSLKLSITNVNKGDSIKWFYGIKRDLSNISSKYFYDSTKVFAVRTDSNGCSISSDTIYLNVKDQPQFRILGYQTLAYNKDTTHLQILHQTNMLKGSWYLNGNLFSNSDSVVLSKLGDYQYTQTDSNGCNYTEKFTLIKDPQVSFKLKTFYFDIKDNITGGAGLGQGPGTVMYDVNGTEHIINTLATSTAAGAPPLHFIKKAGNWTYEGLYPEGTMSGGARNYSFINNQGEIAFASTGTEAIHPWPLGDIFTVKTIGDKLKWNKLSSAKSFYHSVGTGDMNGDGLSDVLGIHMGTYGNWGEEIHTYLLNKDSSYSEGRGMIDFTNYTDNYQKSYGSTLLIKDIDNDNKNELIKGTYGWDNIGYKYSFLQFKYDSISKKIKYYTQPDQLGMFRDGQKGSTSIKAADIDNDGDLDLVIAMEGPPGGGIQVWLNDGKGNFSPGQIIYTYQDEFGFREFELADINNDGYIDLILHPDGNGNQFRINPQPITQSNPLGSPGDGIILNSSIYINQKSKFTKLNSNIVFPGLHPDFMKGFYYNNQLKFIGFEEKSSNNNPTFSDYNLNDFYLYEVDINFCKNLVKPSISYSKTSFCAGDSANLSINNVYKGDTLKWFYGVNTDFSNVNNKTFKDSAKVYVVRVDSLGCSISSDTITLVKNLNPTTPQVSDTTFCQNITSSKLNAINTSGSTLAWYGNNATEGTATTSNPSAVTLDTTTKYYYVSQINSTTGCESPRAKITVKINPAPGLPTVRDTSYCNNANVDTLRVNPSTGNSLLWYGTNATGGTGSILASKPTTNIVGTFGYYVSQITITTGCEGQRAKINVTINPLPSSPLVRDTSYCNNATSDTIRVNPSTGNSLLWYGTNATGGTATSTSIKPSTSTVGTTSYYVSQQTNATGCEGPRSKINITTYSIPSAPLLSRDTANNLIASINGITWYKDGTVITDTTQKIKPTIGGSYTAKTTQNGCISALSTPYYYLVTDIINLSADEFIKLAPNPFSNQLNFDFVVKGYQRLNMEVFDLASGSRVANKQNLTPGIPIYLGQLSAGTYVIKVTSNDLKVSYQFKMVKL